MTTVTVWEDGISASGHSGYRIGADDIVCAGISTVMFGLCSLYPYTIEDTKITVYGISREAKRLAVASLSNIAEKYPDNLKINQIEKGETK